MGGKPSLMPYLAAMIVIGGLGVIVTLAVYKPVGLALVMLGVFIGGAGRVLRR